jgi:hypothetical protein
MDVETAEVKQRATVPDERAAALVEMGHEFLTLRRRGRGATSSDASLGRRYILHLGRESP